MKENLVQKIVDMEWEMFDRVNSIGGRAPCQDDRRTFYIMRTSKAEAWPKELCQSYLNNLIQAGAENRNLMTEKYARMMESTSPDEYASFSALLPKLDGDTLETIEKIIGVNIKWRVETSRNYPNLSFRGRSVFSKDDTPYETSFETYLRGELRTYSPETVKLYHKMVSAHFNAGENLEEIYLLNTVKKYGYESLEQADQFSG